MPAGFLLVAHSATNNPAVIETKYILFSKSMTPQHKYI
jgi:hypothetical protein